MKGNQYVAMVVVVCNQFATLDDSFKAAAKPIKKAANEKVATINPLLKPLMIAAIKMNKKRISINIK